MVTLILIGLFFSLLFVLPLQIIVQSNTGKYYIGIPFYFSFSLVPADGLFQINGSIFFIRFKISPRALFGKKKPGKKKQHKKEKEKKSRLSFLQAATLAKEIFKAFTVDHVQVLFDTGDYPVNAQLMPVVARLNSPGVSIQVNFENKNEIDAKVYTRLYKLMWIVIKNVITNQN